MLDSIIASTRLRVTALAAKRARLEAAAAGAPPARDFASSLVAAGLSVIAEVKRHSPSVGAIAPDLDPGAMAVEYETGGAAAVSVLTEPDHFHGGLGDLAAVRDVVSIPVLRKDFIIDPVQIFEARAAQADAVLLIVALLDDPSLHDLLALARRLGMAVLVEAHDGSEIARGLAAGARIIGINNRDLATFQVDLGTAERLRALIPAEVTTVAESGISSPADSRRMAAAGFDAVLVGQAAAQHQNPGAFVRSLRS